MHISGEWNIGKRGTVLFFQDIIPNLDDIIGPYADHETVKGGMVQFAEGNTVIHNGISIGFSIRDDMSRVQKFKMLLAAMCSHIPNRGEQMVRYYGYYSNVSRGKRKEAGTDYVIPCILEPQGDSKAFRKSWARLIQKIYEVDPLVCPKCRGTMRIISFIEDPSVIRAILEHLGLWLARARPPPKISYAADALFSHSSANTQFRKQAQDEVYGNPEYSWDDYIQS